MKSKPKPLKRLPRLENDAQAERFVAESDLTRYDLSALQPTRFEFAPKEGASQYAPPEQAAEGGQTGGG